LAESSAARSPTRYVVKNITDRATEVPLTGEACGLSYLRDQTKKRGVCLSLLTPAYVREFKKNLQARIAHYRQLAGHLAASLRTIFLESLARHQEAVENVPELT